MDSTQDPVDDDFLARLRNLLGQPPDDLDDMAMKVVRDRVSAASDAAGDECGSGDSSG